MAISIVAKAWRSGPKGEDAKVPVARAVEGDVIELEIEGILAKHQHAARTSTRWNVEGATAPAADAADQTKATWNTAGLQAGPYRLTAQFEAEGTTHAAQTDIMIQPRPLSAGDTLAVALQRSAEPVTADQPLWIAIRNRTKAIGFGGARTGPTGLPIGTGYQEFIDRVLCKGDRLATAGLRSDQKAQLDHLEHWSQSAQRRALSHGIGAYELLKAATEVFLLLECGVVINERGVADTIDAPALFDPTDEATRLGAPVTLADLGNRLKQYLVGQKTLPYIDRILEAVYPDQAETDSVFCYGVVRSRVECPCLLELIWSYWHEEGMLAQSMSAISRRFQNIRGPGDRDPLAHLDIAPLRPLNNLLWGYIQDEANRLSVKRRAYEYDHHYGLTLYGKAVPTLRSADSRSKFLEGFHHLLHLCSVFFKEDNDTTVIADGYPLLNALKEVHLLLAQGAHNQFGDLPWTARAEMLIQQWLLARPEMRDFLQSRPMVPYVEGWMPQVDTMKTLQGWSDVTITHFRDLGAYGEQILLSVRYGDWMDVNDENRAKNWARYWRPEIQGYLHAYRAVSGVDLTNPDTVDASMPGLHLQKRLEMQKAR